MSDYDLPDLPSDEELGITEEDVEKYGDELPDDGPEMSDEEMKELLGGTGRQSGGGEEAAAGPEDAKEARRAAKKRAKAEKKRARREKKERAKEAKRQARAQKQAAEQAGAQKVSKGASGGDAPPPDASGGSPGDEAAGRASGSGASEADGGPDGPDGPEPSGGPDALAPMPAWRGPVTLLLLAGLALFASSRTGQIEPAPPNAPESEFSAARAMSTLVDIAREPHPAGSPEHARVRELLLERLRQLGLEPEVQTATSLLERRGAVSGDPAVARAATVRNIVARIPGANPTGAILVTAHYDSREIAVGAGDDGTGVVAILEAIRALRTGQPLRNDVIVLLTDGEELGLMGARAFVDQHPWMPDVDLVLSFEMRGGAGPSIMFETNDRNGWIVRQLQAFDPHPFANSLSYEVYERMPRDTDFTPFREAGVQGLNFAGIDRANVYHQVYDVPDNVSPSTVQHHGVRALAGLRHLGNADLTSVDDANVVFFSVPVLGLVVYERMWVMALSALLLGAFVVLLLAARRAGVRTSRIAAGSLASVAVAVVAFFIAGFGFRWLTAFHPEYGALQGSAFHSEGWYVLAIVFSVLLLLSGGAALTRRWIAPLELTVGALLLPLAAAVLMGFVAPLAAMNLQWPVAAALLAATVMALLQSRGSGVVGWITYVALAVPVVLLLQPVLELLWLAMSLELAGWLAIVAAVGFFLVLPLLGSLDAPNRWWAPATFAVLTGATLGAGVLSSNPSADAPAPSTLVYAYEYGSDEAVWATSPGTGDGGSSSDAGRAWAQERVGGPFAGRASLEVFGYIPDTVPVAPARALLSEPPTVDVVTDTVLGEARRAVLHVRSRIGAEMLAFQLEGETRLTSINGQPISNVEELRWIDHWGAPDTAVVLELTMPPSSPIDVHVVEHLLRPEELLGRDAFRRPPELAANVNRSSDRAMFRYSVATFADPMHATGEDIVTPPPDTTAAPVDTLSSPPDTSVTAIDTLTTADPRRRESR